MAVLGTGPALAHGATAPARGKKPKPAPAAPLVVPPAGKEGSRRVDLAELAEHGRVYATLLRMAAGVPTRRLAYVLAFRLLPPWTLQLATLGLLFYSKQAPLPAVSVNVLLVQLCALCMSSCTVLTVLLGPCVRQAWLVTRSPWSRCGRALPFLLSAVDMAIQVAVLVCGGQVILRSEEILEIVLNACAINYISDLDEIFLKFTSVIAPQDYGFSVPTWAVLGRKDVATDVFARERWGRCYGRALHAGVTLNVLPVAGAGVLYAGAAHPGFVFFCLVPLLVVPFALATFCPGPERDDAVEPRAAGMLVTALHRLKWGRGGKVGDVQPPSVEDEDLV